MNQADDWSATILSDLSTYALFQGLPVELLQEMARVARLEPRLPGPIFEQGEDAEEVVAFFILHKGVAIETRRDGAGRDVFRRLLRVGQAFGHRGILEGGRQLSTVRLRNAGETLRISAADFTRLCARYPALRERLLQPAVAGRLRALPFCAPLSDDQVRWMTDLVTVRQAAPGAELIVPGRREPALCLISQGQVLIRGGECQHTILAGGHWFGRWPDLGPRRALAAQAIEPTTLYCLTARDVRWLTTVHPEIETLLVQLPDPIGRLRATQLFSRLSAVELEALAAYLCWEYAPPRRPVVEQGRTSGTFLILDRGEAVARSLDDRGQERPLDFLMPGRSLGETALMLKEPHEATVEAITPTFWLVLHSDDFAHFLAAYPDARQKLMLRSDTQTKLQASVELSRLSRSRRAVRSSDTRARLWPSVEVGAGQPESVVLQTRRHWWVLANWIGLPSGFFVVLLIGLTAGLRLHLGPAFEEVLGVAALIALGFVVWGVVDWSNDWLIITTRRVIHRETVILISERTTAAPLEKIQDIKITRSFLGSLIGYGELIIQTAATVGQIRFDHVGDPEGIKQRIWDQVARVRAGTRAEERERASEVLEQRLQLGLPPSRLPPIVGGQPAPPPQKDEPRRGFRLFPFRETMGDRVIWRKHWLNLILRTGWPFLATLILGAVVVWMGLSFENFARPDQAASILLVVLLFFLGVLAWLGWEYADWRNDVYIVTNERIIDIQKKPLFFAEVRREAPLDNVQNVDVIIPGPLAHLLGYGNVIIQTAAETGQFDFVFVGSPREVQAEISRRTEALRATRAERERIQRQNELAMWFEAYHRLQRNGQ
jgi:CRP-like cAMP-binding protein/membrane protein YdbS with pleckstrin-like domain